MNTPTISVQLYSVREHFADLEGTLSRIAGMGITAVEPFSILDRPEVLAAALERTGLTAPTGHAPFLADHIDYQGRSVPLPPLEASLEAASQLGIKTLFDPMVPPARWYKADDIARTAERLNKAAEVAANYNLSLGYHNHSFEFHQTIEGVSAYEYFVSLLDNRVVLEVDVYWAATAAQDVPSLLQRLDGRVRALHIKDGDVALDPFAAGGEYRAQALLQSPAGAGALPLREILKHASRAYDVIEFDHLDSDAFAAIEASAAFLRAEHGSVQ